MKKKSGSNWKCYYVLFKNSIIKPLVKRHVFAQSPPDRLPSDKYPVNNSHRSRFVQKHFTRSSVW
jgi:hypothetical protein